MPPRKTNSSSGGVRASVSEPPAAPGDGAVDASPQPPAQHGPSDRDSAASVAFADNFTPSPQEPLENTEDSDDSAGKMRHLCKIAFSPCWILRSLLVRPLLSGFKTSLTRRHLFVLVFFRGTLRTLN